MRSTTGLSVLTSTEGAISNGSWFMVSGSCLGLFWVKSGLAVGFSWVLLGLPPLLPLAFCFAMYS